jgi:electron transfer flavoprotein alpha subunit
MKTLIIALQKDGHLVSSTFEAIEAVKSLGGELYTTVLAADAGPLANDLASKGGGKVLAVSNSALRYYVDDIYARVISVLIKKYSPELVICPATFYGKALMARLAGMNGGKMASDVTAVADERGQIVVTRPSHGGSVIAHVSGTGSGPLFITLRPKIYPESQSGQGEVITENIDPSILTGKTMVKEMKKETGGTQNLSEADVIVSAGRGIRGPENVPLIQELADSLGGALGATRAVVDAGWIAYSHQIGQTGRTVNPKLYVAVGISGAIQHLVGMQTSKTIVAVNKDKDAAIFNIAGYGIVGDLFEIVPALTRRFKAELKH